jgi:hypothetical protein
MSCEGAEDLPRIMEFKDLHLTESLKEAKEVLKDQAGVYCMLCQVFFILNIKPSDYYIIYNNWNICNIFGKSADRCDVHWELM